MTATEKHAEVRRLVASGLSHAEVAARLGYAGSGAVTKIINVEATREYNRVSNARRRAAKLAWTHTNTRAVCPCGAAMGTNSKYAGRSLCAPCYRLTIAVETAMTRERIQAMWVDGLTARQIAVVLERSTAAITRQVTLMRREGWEMPFHHTWTAANLARVRAPHASR